MSGNGAAGPIRLVQVSDTHLSRVRAYFNDNFEVFAAAMRAETPDLIVHTGDLALDGPDEKDDLVFARSAMEAIGLPWRAIAGNHDLGEAPRFSRLSQPLNAARLDRWRGLIGDLFWTSDLGAWRLIGLDTALMASDLPEEAAQNAFLDAALATAGGRPVMVFMHMPPFTDAPDDPAFSTSCVPFEARLPLLDRLASGGVKVIACGHCHVYHRVDHRGMEIVWAPGTAFVNMKREFERRGNFPRSGYLRWMIDGATIRHELVEPALMIAHDVGRWNDEVGSTTKMPPRPLARPAPAYAPAAQASAMSSVSNS